MSEKVASWSSSRVVGSEAHLERGMGPTKQNPLHGNPGWFSGDNTIILDGGGEWAPDKISEVIASWEIPVEAEIVDAAEHGFLIIACVREFGGLHTSIDDKRVSIVLNDTQLDYFGLRVKPPGHTDFFHVPRREPHWPWLWDTDPIIAGCQTIYAWPIQKAHLRHASTQVVKVVLESEVCWDIDYVALLLCEEKQHFGRLWTNGCKGRAITIGEKDFQQVCRNKAGYDSFLHHKGDFKLGLVKEIVLGEKTVLGSVDAEQEIPNSNVGDGLTRHGFRILVKSLRNDGEREPLASLAKECWIENPGFVRGVENRWKEYLKAENLYEDFRKVASRIIKEISVLNATMRSCGLDSAVKTERGLYWMSPVPRYCIVEENEN